MKKSIKRNVKRKETNNKRKVQMRIKRKEMKKTLKRKVQMWIKRKEMKKGINVDKKILRGYNNIK
jgi:hypothetical protein